MLVDCRCGARGRAHWAAGAPLSGAGGRDVAATMASRNARNCGSASASPKSAVDSVASASVLNRARSAGSASSCRTASADSVLPPEHTHARTAQTCQAALRVLPWPRRGDNGPMRARSSAVSGPAAGPPADAAAAASCVTGAGGAAWPSTSSFPVIAGAAPVAAAAAAAATSACPHCVSVWPLPPPRLSTKARRRGRGAGMGRVGRVPLWTW